MESKPNEGSRFTVTVFLRTQEGKQGAEQGRSGNADVSALDGYRNRHLEGKRVLLVEDNDLNAEIVAEILGMTGLAVDLAQNGRDAVRILTDSEDGRYDLVFMDIHMPVLDGYKSTRIIRGKDREYLKNIPIVAMSANAFTEDIRMAKEAGMNEHLAKPLDFERLLDVLDRWLNL